MKKVLLLTAITSLAARAIFAVTLLNSPLAELNFLPGLDMATLLEFSEWSSGKHDSTPMFVLHRFLLFFCYLISGKCHNTAVIYAVQSLAGVAGAVFCSWGMFRLCKELRCAAISGVIYALYSPFLLYEGVALQESILAHTFTIALALLIAFTNAERDATACGLAAGIMLGLNSSGRPATSAAAVILIGFVMYQTRKSNNKKALSAPLCGLLAVWLTAALFNGFFRSSYSPFFNVMPHLVELHSGEPAASAAEIRSETVNPAVQYLRVLWGAIKNSPHIFGMREIPENLDFNVISREFPVLFFGPGLLMLTAVTGMVTFILLKKRSMLILYIAIAACILPLSARIPIGRYRLILIPVFIWFAAMLINELISNKNKRLAICAIAIGIAGVNLLFDYPIVRPNPAAYHTLALAAKKAGDTDGYVGYLKKSYFSESNSAYKNSGLLLTLHYLQNRDFSGAEKVILSDRSKAPEFTYYLALIRTSQNRKTEALELLSKIGEPEQLGVLQNKYHALKSFLSAK